MTKTFAKIRDDEVVPPQPTYGMQANLERHRYISAVHRDLWSQFVADVPHVETLGDITETVEVVAETRMQVAAIIERAGFQPDTRQDDGPPLLPMYWDRGDLHIELRRACRMPPNQFRQGGYDMPGVIIAVWRKIPNMGVELIDPKGILAK